VQCPETFAAGTIPVTVANDYSYFCFFTHDPNLLFESKIK